MTGMMLTDEWTTLLEHLLWSRTTSDACGYQWTDANVQIRDSRNNHYVLFATNSTDVRIAVGIPADPTAAARLNAVIAAQPGELWRESANRLDPALDAAEAWPPRMLQWTQPTPRQARTELSVAPPREWRTNCEHYPKWADSLVLNWSLRAVLRDGLEMSLEHLRFSVWNSTGPLHDRQWGAFDTVVPDRPTARDRTEHQCTNWNDFLERLTWVLTTLPQDSELILRSPRRTTASGLVRFKRARTATSQAVLYDDAPTSENHHHMGDIGWWHAPRFAPDLEASNWIDPCEYTDLCPSRRDVAERTVATFRDVLALNSPQQIICQVFSRNHPTGGAYIHPELGLPVPTLEIE